MITTTLQLDPNKNRERSMFLNYWANIEFTLDVRILLNYEKS